MSSRKVSEAKLSEKERRKRVGIAMTAVRHLERPDDVSRTRWLAVQEVLITLCVFLPDPYPNQETIADKSDLSLRTTRRVLATAEKLGLIERRWREHGRWDSHGYTLTFLPDGLFTSGQSGRTTSGQVGRSRPAKVSTHTTSPHGEGDKRAPSVSSPNSPSAASPAAAAATGQRGINHSPTECVECGHDLDVGEATSARNKIGFRCHDREACKGRQTERATAQAEHERQRLEKEQAQRDYERSPEGVAAREAERVKAEARRLWLLEHPTPEMIAAADKRKERERYESWVRSQRMECGCNITHFRHRNDCPTHAHELNAEFREHKRRA